MTTVAHPLTQVRLARLTETRQAIRDYAEAYALYRQGQATQEAMERKMGIYKQSLQRLVEAAQAEGAAG